MEASGFRNHKDLTLDFNECRLIRIRGQNGVGKSTIVESLAWTLFGRLRDGDSIRTATHRGPRLQQRWPEVTWTIELGGERLRISRWNGGAQVENGQGTAIETGSQRVADFMAARLGIENDILRATAWCLQGEVLRPVAMARQERRRLIRRFLLQDRQSSANEAYRHTDPVEPADMVRKAQEQLKKTRSKLEKATGEVKKAEEQEAAARKRLDKLQERWKRSMERRSQHRVLLATIAGLERQRDGLHQHLEDCVANLRDMRGIEDRANRYDPSVLDRAIARLEKDLIKLDLLDTAIQDTRERRLVQNTGAKARGDWYAAVSETLASAIAKGQCSTCERRIRTRHATLTKKKLDQAHTEAKLSRLESVRTEAPGTDEIALSDDIRQLAREIDALQNRVNELQYEHGYCEAAKSLLNRIPAQVAKHAELEGELSEVVRSIEQCKQELDDNGYCDEEHQRLDDELGQAEAEWRGASAAAKSLREERDRLDRECWELAEEAVDTSAEAVAVHTIEEKVRSDLEQKMDEVVKYLTCGDSSRPPLAVSVDKDFKPTLHENDSSGSEVYSPGLNAIVALAMRLALLRLKKKHCPDAGSVGDLVILDEAFANVDSSRAEAFHKLLLEDDQWAVNQVLEIGSASRADYTSSEAVCTVRLDDGNTVVERSGANT